VPVDAASDGSASEINKPLKRPIGVALSACWLLLLLVGLSFLAFWFGGPSIGSGVLLVSVAMGRMAVGLWRAERWAWQALRALLLVGVIVNVVLAFIGSAQHGRLYHAGRAVVFAAWLWYLCRVNVRAYFGRQAAAPVAATGA
jgi:hypothetical protein